MRSPETAWQRGRFRGGGPRRVLFGRMYEDPSIEARAFPAGGRVFCIASAGCTARDLAQRHDVVAVDINPVQLAYAARRLAGSPVEPGTAERVMDGLRRLLPLAGLARRELEAFLALDDPAEQVARWRERLLTRRFRLGVDLLLSVTGLRAFYDSPFLAGLPRHFGRVLLSRLERGFARHPNLTNPWARSLLLGGVDDENANPPPRRVELHCVDAAGYLESQPAASFSGFTLSNVLDGAQPAYRTRLLAAVARAATPDAVLVLRSFAEPATPAAAELAAGDRSMLWGVVQAVPARGVA